MFDNEQENSSEQQTTYDQNLEAENSQQSEQPSVMDLDSVERFRFQGKEWTPQELRQAYLMQSDYTKKTQALAEERKFIDNLTYDLEKVVKNPALAKEFMTIYPKKYHGVLNQVIREQQTLGSNKTQQPDQQKQSGNIDPEFMRRFEAVEQQLYEKQVNAINAELDSKFKTLGEKYPGADEEAVVARAMYLHDQGYQLNDKQWDALFKASHEKVMGLGLKQSKEQAAKQKELNSKGKDVASGGGIPGQAPRRPRSIKEATNFALEEINSS